MASSVTLEEVEHLAEMLPFQDQLKLMARVSERLSKVVPEETAQRQAPLQDRLRLAEQLLAEVEGIEDDAEGATESADAVRQLRERRTA